MEGLSPGQSDVGCKTGTTPSTRQFDVWGPHTPATKVRCAGTFCGNPEDVLTIDLGVSYTCSDSSNKCTFSCPNHASANEPESLLCDAQTLQFLTGSRKRVSCSNCPSFGPDSSFTLATGLLNMQTACKYVTKGDEDIHLSIQCDLICLNRAIPSVDLSKQLLERVRCVKNANTGASKWISLVRDQFGLTSVVPFKSTGTVNRDIINTS